MMSVLLLLAQLHAPTSFAGDDDLAYFKQFLFAEESIGSDPDFPQVQYRYLMMNDFTFKTPDQKTVHASASLQMFPDGHTVVVYREMIEMVFPGSPAGTPPSLMPNGCKTFQGTWSVPDTQLIASDFGTGTRDYVATMYPPQAVKINFGENFISQGLQGSAATFYYGISNVASETDFCF